MDEYIDRHARKSGEYLKTWGARLRRRWIEVTGEECDLPLTLKDCQCLHHDLLQADDETFENVYASASSVVDIHFEECPVGRDLERPHQNRSLMNKWVGDVPRPEENPAYAFNIPIFGHNYKENPYIPQLISASRQKIKEVYQIELHRKKQIKSAIVVLCLYSVTKRNPDNSTYCIKTIKKYIIEVECDQFFQRGI